MIIRAPDCLMYTYVWKLDSLCNISLERYGAKFEYKFRVGSEKNPKRKSVA